MLIDRGDLAGAQRRARHATATRATGRTARATGCTRACGCCSRRGAGRRRSPPPTSSRERFAAHATPRARRGAWCAPRRSSGSAGIDEARVAGRGGARGRAASGARPARSAARSRSSAGSSARTGIPRLEEAVALLERHPRAARALARALAALGSALRHARRPAEAREPLRRALELATACGAPPLAEQARSELYAAGARPRTEALAGVEALTASEKRVADLAATGDTNRDIAQTLYVTPKTVEVHLSNAYRKLGIRSRRELAGALGAAS